MSRCRPDDFRPRTRTAIRIICAAAASVFAPLGAAAQVLEIGDGGEVTVHDGPAVFDASGTTPIRAAEAVIPPVAAAAASPSRSYTMAALAEAASVTGLSPDLVEAVAWRESRLRAGVVSRAGAIGEMQLMPGTARQMGVNPYDTRQNFHGGARYLSQMMSRYNGDLVLALAAYNAGPGAVDRYRGVPPYRETRAYVSAVLERLGERAAAQAASPAGR